VTFVGFGEELEQPEIYDFIARREEGIDCDLIEGIHDIGYVPDAAHRVRSELK
jgi:hypothetical protein